MVAPALSNVHGLPRVQPRWMPISAPDPAFVAALVDQLGLPSPICELLVVRGLCDSTSARTFLKPGPAQLHPPLLLAGIEAAVGRIAAAIRQHETILVHGDYDVDGICSTALIVRALEMMGGRAVPFAPHRLDHGYDLGDAGIQAARDAAATLIVTADCGIVAHHAVDAARRFGIDVVVTDHHAPAPTLPSAIAVVNPNRLDCGYPDKGLAGVGVAFKLMLALAAEIGFPPERLNTLLDLVALATVADLAPLTAENRALVRWGLAVLRRTPNPGLRALLRTCGLGVQEEISAGQVGYTLAPRLNAAGRMGDAMRGVRLLLTNDPAEAHALADELEVENRRRKDLDQETLADVVRSLEATYSPDRDRGVVLASDRWHPGVIGIVASRVVELVHRPTVLIAIAGGEGKGSGRSVAGFHLQEAFVACSEHLIRFGGHRAAAGCSIDPERIDAFREAFDREASARLSEDQLMPQIRIDAEISIGSATPDLLRYLRHFAPFGIGNPTPVFVAYGVGLAAAPRLVGKDHLKLTLADGGARLDAIGFGMGDRIAECAGRRLDVAFKLEENNWTDRNGVTRATVQARLVDLRAAG